MFGWKRTAPEIRQLAHLPTSRRLHGRPSWTARSCKGCGAFPFVAMNVTLSGVIEDAVASETQLQ